MIAAGPARASTPSWSSSRALRGQRLRVRQAARADDAARGARPVRRAATVAREAFGEEVVDHYLNNARVELDGVRGGRHRLGARPGVRAAVSSRRRSDGGLRAGPVADGVRGDARAARHRDQARPARARHAAAGRARAVRAARHRALDAAPGADRARAERAPARGARPRRRDVRRRRPPPADRARAELLASWRDAATCGSRSSSASRCSPPSARTPSALAPLERAGRARWTALLDDFPAYRQADVRFHIGLAEATGCAAARGGDDRGPGRDDRPDRLHRAPARGARVVQRAARAAASPAVAAARRRPRDARSWPSTCSGTEHVLAGLLPSRLTGRGSRRIRLARLEGRRTRPFRSRGADGHD